MESVSRRAMVAAMKATTSIQLGWLAHGLAIGAIDRIASPLTRIRGSDRLLGVEDSGFQT